MFQEPASPKFLCERCFRELFPEIDIIACIKKVNVALKWNQLLLCLISHCAVNANSSLVILAVTRKA